MNETEIISTILSKGYVMTLATADKNGPWACDLIYVFDTHYNLYWLSHPTLRHSVAIRENNKIAATITLSNSPDGLDEGLQIEGVATELQETRLDLAILLQTKRKKPAPQQESDFMNKGRKWYCLKPTKIEIIFEKLFGYTKKIYIPSNAGN